MLSRTQLILTIAVAVLIAPCASAQQSDKARDDRPSAGIANDETLGGLRPGRVLVLREGSYLKDARGSMHRDPGSNWWRFVLDSDEPGKPGHQLTVLPCTRLEEMQSQVESMPDHTIVFQLTGQVFVFDNHNFLLPVHAPIVSYDEISAGADDADTPPDDTSPNATSDDADTAADTAPSGARDPGRSIADIERSLITGVGDVKRSHDAGSALDVNRRVADVIRESTILVQRRGSLSRTPGGAWSFVLDADAEGLEDPPLTLLPCLLLHRIEAHTRRIGDHAPAMISGRVYVYQGRNYLLPTTFRIPEERTKLSP